MTIEEIRNQFPYLKTGRIYLNHAATSAWSKYVIDMVEQFRFARSEGDIEIYPQAMQVIKETRALAASMLNVAPERIAFVQNTSVGLAVLASGLAWKTGDRILLVEKEFPANVYPFLNLARLGVELDFVPQVNGMIELPDIERMITPKTKLLSISSVQFLSGFKIDLKAVGDICAARNVLFCVDGIQSVGALHHDLMETPVDFLSAGVQKWQMGLQGVAIMYVSEKTQDMISQSHAGWLSVKNAWDFFDYKLDFLDDARRYENATYNSIGIYGYNGALRLFHDVGFGQVEKLVLANAEHAFSKAAELGFDMLTPADPAQRAGIVTFRHPESERINQELLAQKITISARAGCLRISPHFYNTFDEIDATLEAIAMIK